MPCPFTARLSASYLAKYAPSLLQIYAGQCPVVSRAAASYHQPAALAADGGAGAAQCPFLLDTLHKGEVKDKKVVVRKAEDAEVIEVAKRKSDGERAECVDILRTFCCGEVA